MNQFSRVFLVGGLALLLGAGCQQNVPEGAVNNSDVSSTASSDASQDMPEHPGLLADERIQNKQVRISTEKGDIVFNLFPDTAPMTVSNFVHLAEQGYYDGLIFHRVVADFVIQGGDPTGTGRGGPGYQFADELGTDHIPSDLLDRMEDDDERALYRRGIVAMANAGPDTNGSQFFVMLGDIPVSNMPNLYSIFGEVTEGMEVVDEIAIGDVMTKVTVEERVQ